MSPHDSQKIADEPLVAGDQIHHREYKLMLDPERFRDEEGFHKFWKIAHHATEALGIGFAKPGKEFKPLVREVIFYDTPHFKLYSHGFILRKRTFFKHGAPEPNYELVLKFRHPDKQTAASVDVRPLLPCIHTIKFKEEVLLPKENALGLRFVYSHNCELDTPNILLTQKFETIAYAFPALQKIDANPKALLAPVHNSISEQLVNLGQLDFGGKMTAKATLAIWRVRTTDAPLIAEFGYQIKFDRSEDFRGKPRKLSELLYTSLQSRAEEWIRRGTTKTALVYGLGNTRVKHEE
jgi:hypothetical protein